MAHNHVFNHCLLGTVIFLVGVSLALTFIQIGTIQGFAAQGEVVDHDNVSDAGTRVYVAKTGNATAPTIGWSTAFTNVQDALAADEDPSEIWVAEGIYYPDVGRYQDDNNENSTFVLRNGVALYGGFDTNDTNFDNRDWEKNLTILSGDIDGDDITGGDGVVSDVNNIRGYNAYHVITAVGTAVTPFDSTTILDGFTVTAGYARSSLEDKTESGGGFYSSCSDNGNECSLNLKNILFTGNLARNGGAMFNVAKDRSTNRPSLTNVKFIGNSAVDFGGAIHNLSQVGTSSPILKLVTAYCGITKTKVNLK
jgi:hypothetical protein